MLSFPLAKYKDTLKFDIHIEYIASPRIDGKTLIITDPMLATGSSMELSYQAMLTKGHPAEIHVALSLPAVRLWNIAETLPEDKTTIWCAAIDPEINEHSYIVRDWEMQEIWHSAKRNRYQ